MFLAKLWFSFKDAIFWECTNAGLLSTQAVRGRWIVGGWRSLSCGAEIRGEPRQPAGPQGSHRATLTRGQASRNPRHFLLPLPATRGFGLSRPSQALKRGAAGPDQWGEVGGQAGSQWEGEALSGLAQHCLGKILRLKDYLFFAFLFKKGISFFRNFHRASRKEATSELSDRKYLQNL